LEKIPRQFLYGFCFVLIFLGALSLRTYGLSKYNLWFDEIVTGRYAHDELNVRAARRGVSPAELFFAKLKNDWQPPGYYSLVWLYSCFFHNSIALRWMSVGMGVSALGIFYLISRQILCRWESLGAFVIMAASPFQIWYSQEARPYTTISFFSLLTVYCLMGALRTNKWLWWAAFLCAGIASVSMSYYSIVLFAMAGAVVLSKNKGLLLFRGGICLAFIGAGFIVLMPFLSNQIASICRGAHWLNPPTLRELVFSPLVFTAGYLTLPYQMVLGLILCWLLLVRGLFVFVREEREKFIFLFTCSCLPLLLIFLVSRLGIPIYLDRQLIVFAPFFYLFMARAVGSIKEKAIKLGVIFFIGGFFTMALVNYYQGTIYCYNGKGRDFYQGVHPRKNYGELMRQLLDELRPEDKIIIADLQTLTLTVNNLNTNPLASKREMFILAFSPDILSRFEKEAFIGIYKRDIGVLACGNLDLCGYFYHSRLPELRKFEERDFELQRIWFIFSSWDKDAVFSGNVRFVKKKIFQNKFKKTKSFDRDGVFVELYEKKDVIGR